MFDFTEYSLSDLEKKYTEMLAAYDKCLNLNNQNYLNQLDMMIKYVIFEIETRKKLIENEKKKQLEISKNKSKQESSIKNDSQISITSKPIRDSNV